MGIKELLNIVINPNINAFLINTTKVVTGEIIDFTRFHHEINQAMEEFLAIQQDSETKGRLEIIINDLKSDLKKQISNKDLHLFDDLGKELDERFQTYNIDDDKKEPLKDCFICFILSCIKKLDRYFLNDLTQYIKILEQNRHIAQHDKEIERINQILKSIVNSTLQQTPLKESSVCPQLDDSNKIVGHIGELEQIKERYSKKSNVVFLCGRPGIGKTTLAKRYARQLYGEYKVYFVTYEKSFEHTIGKLAKDDLKNGGQKVLDYWSRTKSEKTILLIIDNFDEDPLQGADKQKTDSELQGEFFKNLVNMGIHILVTTRIRVERNRVDVMPVEEPLDLFEKYYERPIEESIKKIIEEIINVLQGNTLLIILVANILKRFSDATKASDVLDKLKNCRMQDEITEVWIYADIKNIEARTIYLQTEALLDMSGIHNEPAAKEVFANTLMLPLDGMNKQEFLRLTEIENGNVLNNLIDNSWVLTDLNNIYLHTVVREIAIRNGYMSYGFCKNYCKNMKEKIAIENPFEERLAYKNYALEIFKIFKKEKSLDQELLRLFYNLSDIYDKLAERVQAAELVAVVKKHIGVFDAKPMEKAKKLSGIAYSLNNLYDNVEMLEKNYILLNTALVIMDGLDPDQYDKDEYMETKGMIFSNIGSNYLAKSKCDQANKNEYLCQALDWHNQSIELRQKQFEMLTVKHKSTESLEAAIATSHTAIGTDYFYLGDYEQAIEHHLQAVKIREKLYSIEGMSVNQQRIIGCVIEIYKRQSVVDEKLISLILGYYPQILEINHIHENNSALRNNVQNLTVLKSIILNDQQLKYFEEKIMDKCQQVEKFIMSHKELKEMLVDDLPKLRD